MGEVVGSVFEGISLEWFLMVERLKQVVEIEIADFGFFLALGESIVLEVPDSLQESDLR